MENNTDILIDDLISTSSEDSSMIHDGQLYIYILDMLKEQLNEVEIEEIVVFLSKQYEMQYRHSYSHISSTIYQNIPDALEQIESVLDILKNNSDAIYRHALEKGFDNNIKKGFDKFHDHIALEINKLEDLLNKIEQINNTIDTFRSDFSNEMNDTLEKSTKKIKKLSKSKLDRMKKISDNIFAQITSILGIFAAIIFVFFGGTQLFSNALEGIHSISRVQEVGILGFIVTLIGLIMFNLIFMLLYVVSVISGNPIGGMIKWDSEKGLFGFFAVLKQKFPYVIIVNYLFLALLVLMVFLIY